MHEQGVPVIGRQSEVSVPDSGAEGEKRQEGSWDHETEGWRMTQGHSMRL